MRKLLLFICSLLCVQLHAQDFLVPPSINPVLLNHNALQKQLKREKAEEAPRDSVIYAFDTLDLPFVDDFSANHFYKDVNALSDSTYSDSLFYKIYRNGNVFRDSSGLLSDTSFTFQVNANGGVVSSFSNFRGAAAIADLSSYPIRYDTLNIYAPYNIYDTIGGGTDTIAIPPNLFPDSARYYFVGSDTNVFYTDRKVYRNSQFPILPPSIGVATFDGLDENGLPYDLYNDLTVKADYLSSVPLRMGNLADNNVYISFFIQPKGLSLNGPEPEDSLALDFYNPTDNEWGTIWAVKGYTADTFNQHIVKVPDKYYVDGARFRFRSYANSTGAFDHWHLDYIYLNDGRSLNDTSYRDVAYVYQPNSLLKDFQAMPYWHFEANPANYMADSSGKILVKNNDDNGASVFNKVVIPDTVNGTEYYRYPPTPQLSIISPFQNFRFDYPINFDYAPSDVDSAGTFAAEYTIRIGTQGNKDFISSNDTAYGTAVLDNYYAYDDGTAEAGYGVNPEESVSGLSAFIAVEFNQNTMDSIGGMQLYFLPQTRDITRQSFQLVIWAAAQNAGPGEVIYRKDAFFNPFYTRPNGFVTYWLDTLIEVPQRYYVGIKSVGKFSANIGYDLNTNHRDKLFWSHNGNDWFAPSSGIFDGSLMIRPIYRKSFWGVGMAENKQKSKTAFVYPNPGDGRFKIEISAEEKPVSTTLFNMEGKEVFQAPFHGSLDVQSLSKGLYFMRILKEDGSFINKKIILQ